MADVGGGNGVAAGVVAGKSEGTPDARVLCLRFRVMAVEQTHGSRPSAVDKQGRPAKGATLEPVPLATVRMAPVGERADGGSDHFHIDPHGSLVLQWLREEVGKKFSVGDVVEVEVRVKG